MLKKINTKNVFPYWSRRKAHARPQCWDMGTCCFTWVAASCFLVSRNELRCAVRMHGCLSVHVWETQRSREEEGDCNWVESGHLLSSHWRGTRRLLKRTRSPWANQKPSANLLPESIVQSGRRTPAPCQSVNQSLFFFFQVKVCSFCKFINGGQTQHLYLGTASARLEGTRC